MSAYDRQRDADRAEIVRLRKILKDARKCQTNGFHNETRSRLWDWFLKYRDEIDAALAPSVTEPQTDPKCDRCNDTGFTNDQHPNGSYIECDCQDTEPQAGEGT